MKSKEKLLGYKTVKVFGGKYVIRKINPLLDFSYDIMPQIFNAHLTRRQPKQEVNPHPTELQKNLKDMKTIVRVGLVSPELVPVGKGDKYRKEIGITVDDLFMDVELGSQLYLEILAHSLNKFRHGFLDKMRGLFFSMRIRRMLYINYRKNMVNDQSTTFSQTANIQ